MKINTGIHSKHRERLLNTLYDTGLSTASKIEQLEYVLHLCIPVKDTNEISHKLLDKFGSISHVFDAPLNELLKIDGIGLNAAKRLKMFSQIFELYNLDKMGKKITLKNNNQRIAFFKNLLANKNIEEFYIVSLNALGGLVDYKKLSTGSLRAVGIDMQDILSFIGIKRAPAILLAHSHPGGSAEPSLSDIEITEYIRSAIKPFGVEIVDHIIIGFNGVYSIKNQMYLEKYELL